MTLSARDHRILREIENELAAAEPRLYRALVQARFPVLRRRSTVIFDDTKSGRRVWAAAICAPLLVGLGLLTAGLMLHAVVLICAGVPLAQFGPVAVGYLGKRARSSRRRPVNHKELFALLGR
jgi:hypothetical protein